MFKYVLKMNNVSRMDDVLEFMIWFVCFINKYKIFVIIMKVCIIFFY